MNLSIMNEKDIFVMKLVNYFLTKRNYAPIIIHGIDNEIWLENPSEEYQIIRIVTKNIYNDYQFDFDKKKTKHIVKQLKRKMFRLNIKTLSIYIDVGENLTNITNEKSYETIVLKNENSVFKDIILNKYFTDIKNNLLFDESNYELITKLTNNISKKNIEESEKRNNMFRKKIPIVTGILIFINILVFVLMYIFGKGSEDVNTLIDFGAIYIPLVKSGDIYRLFTSAFLHIGILHLLCNMYSLYISGSMIEQFFGKRKFLIIYLVSIIFGSLFTIVLSSENTISAGASGAIFGLFGALLYFGYNYRGYVGNSLINQIVPIIIINLFISFTTPHIGAAAHVGGLIGGYLISYALGANLDEDKKQKTTGYILTIILFIFLVYMGFFK